MWRISFAWPGYVSCAVWQTALQLGYQKCETMKGEKWDGLLVCASNLVCGYKLFIIHILYIYIYIYTHYYIYTYTHNSIYIIVYIYSIYYRMYSISNCFFPPIYDSWGDLYPQGTKMGFWCQVSHPFHFKGEVLQIKSCFQLLKVGEQGPREPETRTWRWNTYLTEKPFL